MRALSGPSSDPAFPLAPSRDKCGEGEPVEVAERGQQRTWIVISFLISSVVATITWTAVLAWSAISLVELALS